MELLSQIVVDIEGNLLICVKHRYGFKLLMKRLPQIIIITIVAMITHVLVL